jgi:Domain of unknown function (DUF3303)
MLFMIQWTFACEHRDAANARFKAGGAPPPEGVKMLGRWHTVGGGKGVLICESTDATAIGKWMQEWNDLLKFEVAPVLDDAGVAAILS